MLLVVCARSAPAQLALGPGIIVASVHDAAGKPIAGALIVADGPTERQATTSQAGIVTLNALPLGTYGLRITRSGYEPTAASVRLGSRAEGPKFVSVRLVGTSFSGLRETTLVAPAGNGADPYVAHALDRLPSVDLVAGEDGRAGISLAGTTPGESRAELDGIPIPGGAADLAALRFRDALALDRIEVAAGPYVDAPELRDAIGGIVNYRTPDITLSPSVGASIGHDSQFGTFQDLRFSDTFGRLGVLTDAVTGGGENRSQTAKLEYAFGSSVALGFSTYGSQSSAGNAQTTVQNLAPAYAADLRAKLGVATLEARTYDSVSDTTIFGSGSGSFGENARVDGLQLGLELPLGTDALSVGFDRRRESATFEAGTSYDQTFSTLTLRTDFALGNVGRLALGAAATSGTQLAERFDPQALFTFHPSRALSVKFAAGSGFATAPDAVRGSEIATAALDVPETSFGYRASVDAPLRGKTRAWATAFELRRFDRFASLADARSSGVAAGVDAPAQPGGLGATAFVELAKTYAYGAPQPLVRYATLEPVLPLAQLTGDPYSKARLALEYRSTAGIVFGVGTTLLGANNALSERAVTLGDASLRLSLGRIGAVTLGLSNAFGAVVADPALAPLYAPRELTLTLGR
jgi:hypothetical protein